MLRTAAFSRVLVVGAGLAGTATAIRLLCFARRPLEIVLLERRADYRSAGVAYHRDGNPWDHVFNIQAGRMSAFREDVLDFVRWTNREADRRDWPAPWAAYEFTEHGPAPRRIFQDYLADRLAHARQQACDGVVLVEADGEAIDIEPCDAGFDVTVRRPGAHDQVPESSVLFADHVVLATGLELRDTPFSAGVLDHPSFVRNPYSVAAIRTLESLPPTASVAIVGSVLSAYDSASHLLRRGHTGTISLISRTGTIFRTYPDDHEHGVIRLACPTSLLRPYLDREEFLDRVRTEWHAACATVRGEHPDIDPEVIAERVTKAWEPHLAEAIAKIPSPELRRLLDEFSTLVAALRVCAVDYTMSVIESAMQPSDGRVRLVLGRVEAITPTDSDRLVVTVAGPEAKQTVEADLVVSNFAREPDYERVDQPLWRRLFERDLAVPHRRTGRGVEVDQRGTLLTSAGEPSGPLSVVGVPREGDEIVRNGRTGAFAFNLAAIKNQSIAVAAQVLEQLELREDGLVRHLAGYRGHLRTLEQASRAGFEEAVVLEVRRLAMRTRSERELLDTELGDCIRSVATAPGAPAYPIDATGRDRLMRVIVTRAAVARLTDVSVTPRQLRRQLGLAAPDEAEV
ncbi:FAD/NAD(P)-binding protein [Actinospica durhamensis]|uniref:FAD/NAD(P)-binding protein n=1 Tax=Actinospica durhamensis TaxID=1508375 RepID=A0A941EUP6_9ACTN|nr:FAD/NAD(P)-binding protein [Actinospica durhamensis]MBR7834244.1 FAD/NAD(P)-binding protein [Actinospica durhamensis]